MNNKPTHPRPDEKPSVPRQVPTFREWYETKRKKEKK
jgi:hypothetical protein